MKLLGPVFWYDLVRVARRQRLALWRTLYASALLVAMYVMYASAFPDASLFWGSRVKGNELAAFATLTFATVGTLLLLFPRVMSITFAAGAFLVALVFGWYVIARRRWRRGDDVP